MGTRFASTQETRIFCLCSLESSALSRSAGVAISTTSYRERDNIGFSWGLQEGWKRARQCGWRGNDDNRVLKGITKMAHKGGRGRWEEEERSERGRSSSMRLGKLAWRDDSTVKPYIAWGFHFIWSEIPGRFPFQHIIWWILHDQTLRERASKQ